MSARPQFDGENLTVPTRFFGKPAVSLIGSVLEAKRLDLLHQLVPNASTLGVLINPKYPGAKIQSQAVQEMAAHIGVKIIG